MDISQAAAIAAASLPILSPYLAKAAEGMSKGAGEIIGKGVAKKVYQLYQTVRTNLLTEGDSPANEALEEATRDPTAAIPRLTPIILQLSAADPEFSTTLVELATDIRNSLLDCFKERFTMPELREVYTRLHVGFDDLIGPPATKSEKAQVLVEKMEMEGRIPELLVAMLRVNPRLNC